MNAPHSLFQRNIVRAISAALIVSGIIVFVPRGFFTPIRSVFAPVVAPFQGFVAWIAFETHDFFQLLLSIRHLKQENERLTRENQRLIQETARWPEIEVENRLLREMLRLPVIPQKALLSAEVISRDVQGAALSMTLNRGSIDGVQPGFPVVVGNGGQLVGRIADVHLTSATVELLSHPESAVATRVTGTSVQGVTRGDHGLGLVFDVALSTDTLERGARIVTSGLGGGFPKDLYIGEIGDIRPSPDRLSQRATVLSIVAESDIRFVSIIIPAL